MSQASETSYRLIVSSRHLLVFARLTDQNRKSSLSWLSCGHFWWAMWAQPSTQPFFWPVTQFFLPNVEHERKDCLTRQKNVLLRRLKWVRSVAMDNCSVVSILTRSSLPCIESSKMAAVAGERRIVLRSYSINTHVLETINYRGIGQLSTKAY